MTAAKASPVYAVGKQAETPSRTKALKWILPIALGLILWAIPAPVGLNSNAWHFFALFVAVITALITEPLPGAAIGLIGVALAAVLHLIGKTPSESTRWALSGFSNDTVWLIFAANMFALGYEVTGLGRRLALALVKRLGGTTLGLGYAVASADLVLAPFMPSNTARSGGTIYPVVRSIPPLYGSLPDRNPGKIGSYLLWTAFASTCVTSSMFLTALAPNLLAVEVARKTASLDISWLEWTRGILPVGIILFLTTPLITYLLCPPEAKRGGEVMSWAARELKSMGRLTRRELAMAILAIVALVGWIGGSCWLSPAIVAVTVIVLMLFARVVSWNDVLGNKQAWNVLVWFGTLVALADGLNSVGFLAWFGSRSAASISHLSPTVVMLAIIAIFFVIHYAFASLTAQTTALLPVFLTVLLGTSAVPMKPTVMVLLYSLGLMGVLTPYASGPSAIYYNSGYISSRQFWRMGAVMGGIFLFMLLVLELPFALEFVH